MQQRVHECLRNSVMSGSIASLIDVSHSLQQNVIDTAVSEQKRRLRVCMYAELQTNILNTCCGLVKRLRKLWIHKLQLSFTKQVTLEIEPPFNGTFTQL